MECLIDRGGKTRIVLKLSDFRGKKYLDIRKWYEDDEGEWKPTRKGLTLPLENVPELVKELQRFAKVARENANK